MSEFQKNWTVDSPWKFNPKMALLSSIFTFDGSTTRPRQKVSCILGMPWDVFDHDQRDFWLWNSHRVKIDRWELEDVLNLVSFWKSSGNAETCSTIYLVKSMSFSALDTSAESSNNFLDINRWLFWKVSIMQM